MLGYLGKLTCKGLQLSTEVSRKHSRSISKAQVTEFFKLRILQLFWKDFQIVLLPYQKLRLHNLLTSRANWSNRHTHAKENAMGTGHPNFTPCFTRRGLYASWPAPCHLSPVLQSTAWVRSLKGKCSHGLAPKTCAWRPSAYRWDTKLRVLTIHWTLPTLSVSILHFHENAIHYKMLFLF